VSLRICSGLQHSHSAHDRHRLPGISCRRHGPPAHRQNHNHLWHSSTSKRSTLPPFPDLLLSPPPSGQNAGESVYNTDEGFSDRVSQIASLLNLKEHKVGKDLVKISVCADIEGHKSNVDGKYYMIDFQRLMPPQVRFTTPGVANADKNPHLYQLLRPELVQTNPVPLSSVRRQFSVQIQIFEILLWIGCIDWAWETRPGEEVSQYGSYRGEQEII